MNNITTERNRIYLHNLEKMLDEIDAETPKMNYASAMAARNEQDNLCAIRCEGLAIRQFGLTVSDDELIRIARQEQWLTPLGVAVCHIGLLSERFGLRVHRLPHASLEHIREALRRQAVVLAFVDGGELTGDLQTERLEDRFFGEFPDHLVVVASLSSNSVTLADPATPRRLDTCPLDRFLDAWADSGHYLITING